MEPGFVVGVLWLLFSGTHIGLASRRVRSVLTARLGDQGFVVFFSLVAAVCFTLLVGYYAAHRSEGVPGLALGGVALLRWASTVVILAGVVLVVVGMGGYAHTPYALLDSGPSRSPRGIERVTRHPFLAGVALVALGHLPLATRLVGVVFAAGFVLHALVGARHQDAKLLARRGTPFAEYLEATSGIPFTAVISGRQRVVWSELPFGYLGLGVAAAFGLRAVHDGIFAHRGVWVIGAVIAAGTAEMVRAWRHTGGARR